MNLREPYAPIEPFSTEMLPLADPHVMYVEQSGNRDGVPVVYLHGGPGSPTSARNRRLFDPDHYRIILFEQRGVGRSKPFADLTDNTTWHLVEDMERLREHLGIKQWHVCGGSWGSTLALAYAQTHPDRCLSLALRGIFLCTRAEIDWFLHGMGMFFPEAERVLLEPIPEEERGDLLEAYGKRLNDSDPAIHLPAARAWAQYEGMCVSLIPEPVATADFGTDDAALTLARLECNYFTNDSWLEPDQLLNGVDKVRDIPTVIVQGRYDVICPIRTADALARAWPEATYHVIEDAGHAVSEPGITSALVEAMDGFRKLG
jgi:proline iminopeptidase